MTAASLLSQSAVLPAAAAEKDLRPILDMTAALADAEQTVHTIDDSDACFTWSEGNANNGGWTAGSQGGAADASEHYANKPGASVSIAFTGNALEICGVKAPNHRMFSVSIDGGEAVELDAWNAARTDGNAVLFSSAEEGMELEEGAHTAVLTVLDKQNEGAVSPVYGLSITYIRVFSGTQTVDPEPDPFPGYTIVEDMDMTDGDELFKVKYNGSWGGGTYYPGTFHDGYEHYAHNGDSFEMKFIGSKVEMWATTGPGHGVYSFYIDGEKVGTGSATTPTRVNQQLIYATPELEYGEHTLKVVLEDQPDMAIQLDYLKVYHEKISATGIALDQSELTMLPGGTASLKATVTPWICTDAEIEWTSSDPDLVSVEDGKLTASDTETKRTAEIRAAVKGTDVQAVCLITVDPTLSVANAYCGNAKRLDLSESYSTLALGGDRNWSGSIWLNDQASSKVVVSSMSRDLHNVEVKASSFTNENGTELSGDAIQISWLEEVSANIGRGNSSAPVKKFPEKIGKGGAIDMAAETVRFAWVTLSSDAATEPGTYTGTLSITADELKESIDMEYTLEVIDLLQPAEEATELQIWQHPFSVANYYLGLGSKPTGGISYDSQDDFYFTEAHFALMRDSAKEYASIGGHDAVANIVEEAWGHQSYYNDPSMVKWIEKEDGSFEFDYTWYDAWIEFMIETGVLDPANGVGQIKAYSIVPWSNQVTWKKAADGSTVKKSLSPGSTQWTEMWTTFLQDYMEHSMEKGWFDITYISMDERGLSDLKKAVNLIESVTNENGESFKISSALNYGAPEYYEFTDRIDDISINLENTSKSQTGALSEHRRALGLKTTFYSCTGDRPSNFMISDPGENYWTIWYSMSLGTDGFMRWAWDNYLYDMHGNASYRYWEPGDGWFIYPLERGSEELVNGKNFYSTPRYEMLKAGMRDAAKAKMLLNSELLSDEEKAELQEAIDALTAPSKNKNYGSAVLPESSRNLIHSGTDSIQAAVQTASRLQAERDDDSQETANKALLQAAVDYADQKVSEGALEGLNVVAKGYFEEKLAAAKAVLADKEASQDEVNQAWRELSHAIHLLDFKADKSALEELIQEAEALNPNQYEDGAAKDEFLAALEHAKEVAGSDTALDASISEAAQRLLEAMNALSPKALDTRMLAWLVSSVENTDLSLYVESTTGAFTEALAHAKAVLEAPESQEQIDSALAQLNDAYLQLRRKPDEETLKALQDFVTLTDSLDYSFFTASEAEGIRAFAGEVKAMLGNAELDAETAREALNRAEEMKSFIENRLEHPEDKKEPAGTPSEDKKDPAKDDNNLQTPSADKKEDQTASKKPAGLASSVKTAAHTALFGVAALGAAALGGLLVLNRKRRNK